MPKDNIDRAIKKGSGDVDGANYEEIRYEGYGPGGVAVLVDTMTDNKNRTVADIRHYFSKSGGNLGEFGCVGWMFDLKGTILIDKENFSEEELMEIAIEAGAEDVIEEENTFQILTAPEDFNTVVDNLEKNNIHFLEASLSMEAKNTIEVAEEKTARSLLKLLENLEDHDDVQKVHANFDIPDELMDSLS
jgi:YebC/PmpR family DNA-binding regulatory protein